MTNYYVSDYAIFGMTTPISEDVIKVAYEVNPELSLYPVEYQLNYLEKVAEFQSIMGQLKDHVRNISDASYQNAQYTHLQRHGGFTDGDVSGTNWKARTQNASSISKNSEQWVADNWDKVKVQLNPNGPKFKSAQEYINFHKNRGVENSKHSYMDYKSKNGGNGRGYWQNITNKNNDFVTKNNIQYTPAKKPGMVSSMGNAMQKDYKAGKTIVNRVTNAYRTGGMNGVRNHFDKNMGRYTQLATGMFKRYSPIIASVAGATTMGRNVMRVNTGMKMLNNATNFVSKNKGMLMGAGGLAIGATALSHAMSRSNDTRMNQ